MNVGVYFPGFAPASGGGYTFEQEILRSLLQIAPESDHQFTLFFTGEEPSELPEARNLDSVWIPTPKPPSRIPSRIKRLISWVSDFIGLQRIVTPSEATLQNEIQNHHIEFVWFPTPAYEPVDVPYIATVWDIQHRNQPWFPEVSQNGLWEHREAYYSAYLKRATYIITPNQAGQDELALYYQISVSRFIKLPHPVPCINFVPTEDDIDAILKKYEIQSPYLLYPAQFWAHKNHANLLKALRFLRETYHLEFELVLCGSDQGNRSYIQKLAEQVGMQHQIHFLNYIPREDLIALYAGAFALTYVTFFGPENLPPLEAFVCGCPVIASNVNGANEQLGNAAIMVDPTNPAEIAMAIKNLYEDPQMRLELIARGYERAKGFSTTDYLHGVLDIVKEFSSIRVNWE